jgi:2-C-methyl-D-erythritol 4-phosphate cytidylyltransferase
LSADVTELLKHARKQDFVLAGHEVSEGVAKLNKSSVVEEYLEAGSIWEYGSPLAATADVISKSLKNVTKKKKAVKSLLEAISLLNLNPRLVKTSNFPKKINSIEQLRAMETIGLPV